MVPPRRDGSDRKRLGQIPENSRVGESGCRRLTRLLCCGRAEEDAASPPPPPGRSAGTKPRAGHSESGSIGGERDAGTTAELGGVLADGTPNEPEPARAERRERAASFSSSLTLSPQPGGRSGGLGRRKKKLTALASLPNLDTRRMKLSVSSEEEMTAIENLARGGADRGDGGQGTGPGSGGGLFMPTINLIPASPSDVLEDDQFFEINSEEGEEERPASPPQSFDSDCVDSSGSHATVERESGDGERPAAPGPGDAGDAQASEASLALPATDAVEHFPGTAGRGDEAVAKSGDGVTNGDGRGGATREDGTATTVATTVKKKKRSFQLNSEITNAQLNAFPQIHPRKGSFNEGINLLQFTEQNLDELNTKESDMRDQLVQEMQKLHLQSDSLNKTTMKRRKKRGSRGERTCSLEEAQPTRGDLGALADAASSSPDEGSPRHRRATLESYAPGLSPPLSDRKTPGAASRDSPDPTAGGGARRRKKPLEDMECDDVGAWLEALGMESLGNVVRGERLAGRHLVSMDAETLERLQLRSWGERERFLSALYSETHGREARAVDTLLQSLSGADLQTFTAAIASLRQPGGPPREEETPRRSPPRGERVSDLRGDLGRIQAAIDRKEEDIARLPRQLPDTDSVRLEEREMGRLQAEMELLDLRRELLGVRSALQLHRIAEAALCARPRGPAVASCLEREWTAASRAGETITVRL